MDSVPYQGKVGMKVTTCNKLCPGKKVKSAYEPSAHKAEAYPRGVLPKILDRGVPRRFLSPDPI